MRQYVSKYVTQFPELLDLVAADDTAMQVSVRVWHLCVDRRFSDLYWTTKHTFV
jgi:hypothetical protein